MFSPLFRSTSGFDRLTRMLNAATRLDSASLGYSPYDIEKTGDDAYRLTMAAAGSRRTSSTLPSRNVLLVTGKAQKEEENKNGGHLHRGARLSDGSASPTI
jgi:molecular chaperone IbpA